ncbi:MAG: FAD:protein FMN transferase, partial [Pseudomonadales bacterium]|nr:FAD:protein FMN transferase [Pseudomonadales bacterium]
MYDSLQGQIFATTYYIRFQQPEQRLPLAPLQAEIDARLAELDQIFSSYKADSELNQFNRLPALQANTSASDPLDSAAMKADSGLAHRSKDFIALFKLSQQIFTASAGAFDPSIGPLVNLWG